MARKTAFIVGASRGLGLGLVHEYLKRGWAVIASVRDLERAAALRQRASSGNGSLRLEMLDINIGAQVDDLATRLAGERFDLLFVNAGVSGPAQQGSREVTIEQVASLFYTNAVAPIRVAETFAAQIVEDTGVIAFMSSRTGSVSEESSGRMPLYRASKAALNSMTRSFVQNFKTLPITVLSLHPGWVRTEMGGQNAPVDVETSAAGLADVIAKRAGTKTHAFLDFQGSELSW